MVTLNAHAKVNLDLRVLGKRDDGFHELSTLMIPISLHDTVEVKFDPEGEGVRLHCSDPDIPQGKGNLAYDAAALYLEGESISGGVEITLDKVVPSGAGLAGGSSDAAAVLRALDAVTGNDAGPERLVELAAQLGSDIPFFLYQSPCRCSGRGEVVEPVEIRGGGVQNLLLVKPEFGVSTPWAYSRWKDSQELKGICYAPQTMPWGEMVNDLERPAFEKYLFLAEMKTWLREQPEVAGALMSGSGSTTFAVLRESSGAVESLIAKVRQFGGEGLWIEAVEAYLEPLSA